ncbi:MAG TPA: carboxypeptidase-like regulatory domain-containing protein, partial [Pyrinomonadaceae bacterium]|nr:carboxypeptidase-like regulatory domain-containing protein [Pyrinomonadaceae bacterium]
MQKFTSLIFSVLLAAAIAVGQGTTGRLSGTVSGPDGVLPGATIVVTDNSTSKEKTVSANESGAFLFPQLDFGTYTIRITAAGFKAFVASEVKIDVGREYTINPSLQIGDIQETVNVTAGADLVTSTTAQVSNTVSPQQIQSLPLLARDPLALITLQAGTQSSTAQGTTINGMRTSFTNITRDGINIQDTYIRTNATDFAPGRPTTDDTAEFTIATANQESDQGYGGAQVRLVTPRGTKDFHGALFAYNRNSYFSANNFFSNRSGTERGVRNRNQFGGKVSGPLPMPAFGDGGPLFHKDKAFFFTSYEKIIDPISARAARVILTPEARTGVFRYNRTGFGAGTPGDAINTMVGTANVTCPEKRTAAQASLCTISNILGFAQGISFTGFPIPNIPTTINPLIQAQVLDQLPSQSNVAGGDSLTTAGFTLNRRGDTERTTSTTRIDVDLTSRDSINGVFSWVREAALRGDADVSFSQRPNASLVSESRFLALAYRRIFTSSIVNEVRGGLFYSDVVFNRDNELPDYFLNLQLVTNPVNNFLDQGRRVKNYNFQDNVDWIVGNHSLKFGGQVQKFNPTSFVNFGTTPLFFVQTVAGVTPTFVAANFPGG